MSFLWACCCSPASSGCVAPHLSVFVYTVCTVCMYYRKRMIKPLERKWRWGNPCLPASILGCEKVLTDSSGTSCTYQTLLLSHCTDYLEIIRTAPFYWQRHAHCRVLHAWPFECSFFFLFLFLKINSCWIYLNIYRVLKGLLLTFSFLIIYQMLSVNHEIDLLLSLSPEQFNLCLYIKWD